MGGIFGFEAGNSVSRTVARSQGNQDIEPWRVAKALDTSTVGGCNVRGGVIPTPPVIFYVWKK